MEATFIRALIMYIHQEKVTRTIIMTMKTMNTTIIMPTKFIYRIVHSFTNKRRLLEDMF
jgi:hypothetical protein